MSVQIFGQAQESPSQVAKDFIQSAFEGDLVKAEELSNNLVIAQGKTYGLKAEKPLPVALQTLHALGYEYHKEMSAVTSTSLSRIFVELIRRNVRETDIEIFEILLVPTKAGWKDSDGERSRIRSSDSD